MQIDEHHDWMDGFDSWEEVRACLHDDWVRVVDVRQRLEVVRDGDVLLVVEVDRRLRARQRRDLHRLGFRPVSVDRVTAWRWTPEEVVDPADPTAVPHPVLALSDSVAPAARRASSEPLRTRLLSDELVSRQAERTVQEVLRSAPEDVAVVALLDEERWDQPWDEDEDESCSCSPGGPDI